jgi:hypothetical protein
MEIEMNFHIINNHICSEAHYAYPRADENRYDEHWANLISHFHIFTFLYFWSEKRYYLNGISLEVIKVSVHSIIHIAFPFNFPFSHPLSLPSAPHWRVISGERNENLFIINHFQLNDSHFVVYIARMLKSFGSDAWSRTTTISVAVK